MAINLEKIVRIKEKKQSPGFSFKGEAKKLDLQPSSNKSLGPGYYNYKEARASSPSYTIRPLSQAEGFVSTKSRFDSENQRYGIKGK